MLQRNQVNIVAYHQKYFHPSCMSTLNLRFDTSEFLSDFYDKVYDQIQIPIELTKTPEDSVLNYFSILREAEKNGYRISGLSRVEEDFLCAPYHVWDYDTKSVVEVKYGNWCKLIKKLYPTKRNGYVKNIYFSGNDGAEYCFIFFTLTNGTDIEISQFRKVGSERWKQITIKPEEECIMKED